MKKHNCFAYCYLGRVWNVNNEKYIYYIGCHGCDRICVVGNVPLLIQGWFNRLDKKRAARKRKLRRILNRIHALERLAK